MSSCSYDGYANGQQSALQCLERDGDVVYASVLEIQRFFTDRSSIASDFSYLCPDGTLQPVSGPACTWLAQPWGTVIASATKAVQIAARMDVWLRNSLTSGGC